ncbi:hypothetical protein ACQEV9_18275 [Streptomyces chartreusis]|uniref:hypothetical protein n=1 Tax=Streptomyces chartreusis TaxID=1969 RepID=UPI003D915622
MRVVVREAFTAYINMQPEDFTPGQKIKGDTAVTLLRSGAAVDPDDDDAADLAEQLHGDTDGQGPEPDPDPDPPQELSPDAPVKEVLAWVGDDPDRASEALELEQAKDQPRSTLVKQLEKIADL